MLIENTNTPYSFKTLSRFVSGSLMIAGTAVGAGMLGIPLVTGEAGFVPGCLITVLVWVFMMCTGLLFLEASLWLPSGSNILSITEKFLGQKGKYFSGFMFLFLYYCLVIAYVAAGAPFIREVIEHSFHISVNQTLSYFLFASVIGSVVTLGSRSIDRTNIILSGAMGVTFLLMMGSGFSSVSYVNLQYQDYGAMAFAVPILFGAFGFHNVIPSLVKYLDRDKFVLRSSIIAGSMAALVIYLFWQYLVLGTVTPAAIEAAHNNGETATHALREMHANPLIFIFARYFSIFALVTSLLGVSFSMVDFYKDGFASIDRYPSRISLAVLIFLPAVICVLINPAIFSYALSIAGGFGEAFLNGTLPVLLVWVGRYLYKMPKDNCLPGGKPVLIILFVASFVAMALEILHLFS